VNSADSLSAFKPAIILSHVQIKPLLAARRAGARTASLSPDLNLTTVTVQLSEMGVRFPGGEWLPWDDAEQIAQAEVGCFVLEAEGVRKVSAFSEVTGRYCSLMPTEGAPTLLVAGFPMHRIKGTDPHRDTLSKIKAAAPAGLVLDTSMGLGYTAIEAARRAERVITIEIDPAVVEVASYNPWSRELFCSAKIERHLGDSFDRVRTFDYNLFTCIIHDPPTFSLAGDLYSAAYYRELYRILKRGGRLFHYIGDLDSPSGQQVARGVIRRLSEAGFQTIARHKEAFGIVGIKRW